MENDKHLAFSWFIGSDVDTVTQSNCSLLGMSFSMGQFVFRVYLYIMHFKKGFGPPVWEEVEKGWERED